MAFNNDFKVKNGLVVATTASILGTTNSTSTTTGALQVHGGIGLGGALQAGGKVVAGLGLYNNGAGVDLTAYDSKVYYVSSAYGSDSNDGHWQNAPFRTIKYALSQVQSGNTVFIQPGTYYESFPITIPQGISVRGAGLREVTVNATTATNTQTAFLLNGECTISDFTVGGFYKPGYAFQYAPGAKITTKSAYIERFSVITKGSVTSATDPYGFNQGDAGNGVKIDGAVLDPTSLEPAMLFNEATFIVPNATGVYMTNGARAELLNGFMYFADKAINAQAGTTGYGGVGKTKLRVSGVNGTFTAGDTLTYKGTTGTVIASGTISTASNGYIYLNGPVWGFNYVYDRTAKSPTAYGGAVVSTAQSKFGGSSLKTTTTGDYVEVLSDLDFQFGTGDYTVEAWVRTNSVAGTQVIYNKGTVSLTSVGAYLNASGKVVANHGTATITGTTTLSANTWYHVRVVRRSATTGIYLYINGTLDASSTSATANVSNTDPFDIGDATNYWNGYIDDFRLSNVARNTGNFTAPTAALGSDPATILMLHFDGANNSTSIVDDPVATQDISSSGASPATASRFTLVDYHQFGAELRCIGSAAVFGNYGVIANGTGTDLKLIAFNMSFIGAGGDLTDDQSLVIQTNEVIQTNGGSVYYQTVDQAGDFRVGSSFLINQRTGNVSFGSAAVDLANLNSLVISDGVHNADIFPTFISVGDINLSAGTVASLTGNLTLDPAGNLTIVNSPLQVNGAATVFAP